MAETVVHLKTRAVVEKLSNTFEIVIASDMNPDGTTTPSVFVGEILQTPKIIDNTEGKEGELMLSHDGETAGKLNDKGELIIQPENDIVNRYSLGGTDKADLIYDDEINNRNYDPEDYDSEDYS